MKKVLVAIPYKKSLNRELYARMAVLSRRMAGKNNDYLIDLVRLENDVVSKGGDPFSAHAAARNLLLDMYLKDHDLVMWIDADLVDYPPDIITRLDGANPGGVTAPVVIIEGTAQFYDTYGYRENGSEINAFQPYFNSQEKLVDLESVGCAYLIPAIVYKNHRYNTTPGQTEHYSIMQAAKSMGMRIVCNTDVTVYHADLPKYGESWHGH